MPHLFDKLSTTRPLSHVVAVGLAFLAMVGVSDYAVGYEVSLSIFFLIPIIYVTWYGRPWTGYAFCGAAAAIWFFIDHASRHPYSNALIPLWNALVRLGVFALTTFLIDNIKEQLVRMAQLAVTDGLTGLLNARAFRDSAGKLLDLALRRRETTAIGYIDVDNFKAVNDRLGHAEGDAVLSAVAQVLIRNMRASDIVGRMGGDEFAVFLPETGSAGARVLFVRIFDELMRTADDAGWPVGFSIGVAVFTRPPPTIDEALRVTDALMYRVKKSGKQNLLLEEAA